MSIKLLHDFLSYFYVHLGFAHLSVNKRLFFSTPEFTICNKVYNFVSF